MEYIIDRSSYRRQANNDNEKKETPQIVYRIIRKLIIQTISCIMLFIIAYTIKLMHLQTINDWLVYEINRDIPIEEAYASIKAYAINIYNKFVNTNSNTLNNNMNENDEKIIDQNDNILYISTDIPNEIAYEEAVEGINQMSDDAKFIKDNYKFIYPISGTVTSRLGVRESDNPIVTSYHSGIDLAANTGTKIRSSLDGKVITATTGEAYGKHIMIQKDDIVLVYAHCSKINVKEGQNVKQGDVIGEVGSTGWATGPHLHFEIRYKGRLVNPDDILDFGE